MPIAFSYDPERQLLVTTVSGVLSAKDFQQSPMPDVAVGTREIFDARGVDTVEVQPAEVRELSITDLEGPRRVTRMAIVLSPDTDNELARTYQTMTESGGTTVAIFRDIDEARRWLGVEA